MAQTQAGSSDWQAIVPKRADLHCHSDASNKTSEALLNHMRVPESYSRPAEVREAAHVQKMKKYLNYIGLGIEPTGQFLHEIRRAATEPEFFAICERFLNHDEPMPLEPFSLSLKETDVLAGEHL